MDRYVEKQKDELKSTAYDFRTENISNLNEQTAIGNSVKRKRALKAVSELRPIDDVFFEKLIEEDGVCEELLQVILEDPGLKVEEIIPQKDIKNLRGRGVRLDAV